MAISLVATAQAVAADGIDYTTGVFIVNEDWYGHQNSTVNYLMPDAEDGEYWHYRVIQNENPGTELGCTNQYGAIFNGRFYLIAKQEKDPGADITGGRITVADAETMKVIYQSEVIDPSGRQCDGRGFVGVTPDKGYISSSNGVWILDLNTLQVVGQVKGTDNPNAGDDKPNSDPTGSLYHGQTGSMVTAGGYVFVAHQQYGLLAVDPEIDEVITVFSMAEIVENEKAGIGSVVKSKDGTLWCSVAGDVQGTGSTLPYLVHIDPAELAVIEVITLPDEIEAPSNSWYAWTPDSFCASSVTNSLYWGGGSRWFRGTNIYRFDIDTNEMRQIIDLDTDGEDWKLYGCSMRLHPKTDEIYMSLYHEFSIPTYITRRYTSEGEKIQDYQMIENYWFPSLPVFPEKTYASGNPEITATGSGIIIEYSDGNIVIKNADGKEASIYTMSGCRIGGASVAGSYFTMPVSDMPTGIYIVKAGDKAEKIAIK